MPDLVVGGDIDGNVRAYNSSGSLQWSKSYTSGVIRCIRHNTNGVVYILDTENSKLYLVNDSDGSTIDDLDVGANDLSFDIDTSNNIYIAGGDTLKKYDSDLQEVWSVDITGGGSINSGVAVDTDGDVYVVRSAGDYTVRKYSGVDGSTDWTFTGDDTARGVAVDDDYVYISWRNVNSSRNFSRHNKSNGDEYWSQKPHSGVNCYGIAVDEDYLYVTFTQVNNIRRFDKTDGSGSDSLNTSDRVYSCACAKEGISLFGDRASGGTLHYVDSTFSSDWTDSGFTGGVFGVATSDGIYGAGFWEDISFIIDGSVTQAGIDALNDAVVSYWAFDENSGTVAEDSKSTNDGTLSNSRIFTSNTGTSGMVNSGADFTQGDDYVSVSGLNNNFPMSEGSFSTWIKTGSTLETNLFGTANDGSTTAFALSLNLGPSGGGDGRIRLYIRDQDGKSLRAGVDTDTGITNNEYRHLVVTWDTNSNTVTMTLDGTPLTISYGNQDSPSNFADFQYDMIIGATNNRGPIINFVNGFMDEVGIYDKGLNSDEIGFLYAEGSPDEEQQYEFSSVSLKIEIIDDFEIYNGSVSLSDNYTDMTGDFSIESGGFNGTQFLRTTMENRRIISNEGGGLNYYPSRGEEIRYRVRLANTNSGSDMFLFGNTTDGSFTGYSGYYCRVGRDSSGVIWFRVDEGNVTLLGSTSSVTFPKNEWLLVIITSTDSELKCEVWNEAETTKLVDLSVNDSTYSSKGVGFASLGGTGTMTVDFDYSHALVEGVFIIEGSVTLNTNATEGAIVRLTNQNTNSYVTSITTDATGGYKFENLSDGVDYHVTVEYFDEETVDDNNEVWSFTGHTSNVLSVAVDADGFVYSGGNDETVRKIDSAGNQVWSFTGHTTIVHGVAVDSDGFVYSASQDDTVRKIDSSGNQVWSFTGHTDTVNDVAVDNSGFVYSASRDNTVRKIDSSGNQVWKFEGHNSSVEGVTVDNNGYVYSTGGSFDGTVRKIDSNGNQVWSFTGHNSTINDVAVDSSGFVYSGSFDNTVRKIDSNGNQVWIFTGHTSSVNGVAVDSNGFVYSASWDDTVRKIDSSGNQVWSFTGHTSAVYDVAVDSSSFVYSGSHDDTVRKFNNEGFILVDEKFYSLSAPYIKPWEDTQ